ncbi:hypothetical protein [Microbacterium imperiale]|uniref:Uncharacterized protein n=1 Tax=Microbacterium imperiale TaxID=33884 RepID=A0A9W6M3D6_9MICO|nr:hypothetical protein [Microbacterium imperiale]MBP2420518.1 hypothetical protein [Microbacterium imperiale]MDS0200536.1 hypothetical protein [Microbacterium imperiale]BFE40859.1 hypothetical protein GCM10017544_18150 [Microbacterium imperiale]GLJ79965.1 hypothetical protein GCM10017586_16480 [Microbacterium imperiale]
MNVDLVLRAVSRTMPAASRSRHLEQWRADVAGASGVGMRPGDVVRGAIAVALTADRDAPALTGEPRGAAPRRLSRRGIALIAAIVAVLVSQWLTGDAGSSGSGIPSALELVLAAAHSVLGVLAFIGALVAVALFAGAAALSRSVAARIAFVVTAAGVAVLTFGWGSAISAEIAAAVVGLTLAGAAVGLAAAWRAMPLVLERRSAPLRRRRPIALAGLAAVAALLGLGAVDTLVWNPLAKVPGWGLDAIYAAMIERDRFEPAVAVAFVAVWAGVWLAVAIAVTAVALGPRGAWLTPRRLGILYLAVIGAALFLRLFSGFGIGMSIADSFAATGGQVSAASLIFDVVGPVSVAVALLLFGWAPAGRVAPYARAGAA